VTKLIEKMNVLILLQIIFCFLFCCFHQIIYPSTFFYGGISLFLCIALTPFVSKSNKSALLKKTHGQKSELLQGKLEKSKK